MNTLKNKKDFEIFIQKKNEYLKNIMSYLGINSLNFSDEEIKIVSQYFINENKKLDFKDNEKLIFITYLGEALICKYGGEWFFTGKRDGFAPNEPVIINYTNALMRYCPMETINKILETNDNNYFNWENTNRENVKNEIDDVFSKLFSKIKKK